MTRLPGSLRERQGAHADVVMDPVGDGVAVADRDPTVVPFRHEDAGRDRIVVAGQSRAEIVVGAVDQRQRRAACRPGPDRASAGIGGQGARVGDDGPAEPVPALDRDARRTASAQHLPSAVGQAQPGSPLAVSRHEHGPRLGQTPRIALPGAQVHGDPAGSMSEARAPSRRAGSRAPAAGPRSGRSPAAPPGSGSRRAARAEPGAPPPSRPRSPPARRSSRQPQAPQPPPPRSTLVG